MMRSRWWFVAQFVITVIALGFYGHLALRLQATTDRLDRCERGERR